MGEPRLGESKFPRNMRNSVRVALAIAVAVACVTVLAVSLTDEQRTAEDSVLEEAAPAPQAKAPVETKYSYTSGGQGHYPAFDRSATGSFSRRRSKLAAQDATGKQFDSMFDKYFQNPSLDLADKMKAAQAAEAASESSTVVGTMGAPTTKTVEVIKEL